MKIGIFKPGISGPGGTETFLRETMKRLQDKHDITLVTDDAPLLEELKEMNVEIIQLPIIRRFYFLVKDWFEIESITLYASSRFRNIFEKIDADVWSTHYWLENLLLSRYLDTPNFFRFAGIKSPHIEWKIMSRLARPDFYLANSRDTARRAKEWFGIECKGTVYAGVDLDQFTPDGDRAFENDDFNIMYVGRIDSGKGLLGLLKVFKNLRKDYENLKLWFVGEGSLMSELESKAAEYGIEEGVEFPGRIDHSEIQKWYRASDLFCLPSIHEGFPVVNMEAMACGKPVLTTDLPATREQFEEGVEGLFFEKNNWTELAEKIEYLIENPKIREEMGKAGRKNSKKFSWDEQIEKMERFYEKCAMG